MRGVVDGMGMNVGECGPNKATVWLEHLQTQGLRLRVWACLDELNALTVLVWKGIFV